MNVKQMRHRVRANAFNHRQMNRTILSMEKSFHTVKKILNPDIRKRK